MSAIAQRATVGNSIQRSIPINTFLIHTIVINCPVYINL
jgi:hypothetical protein